MSPGSTSSVLQAADVERLLAEHFPAGGHRGRVKGPRLTSSKTRIFYAEWPGFPTSLAIKEVRSAGSAVSLAAEARLQFEAMEGASAAFPAEGPFRVPRPFALLTDSCLLVMEWVPGRPLSAELLTWKTPFDAKLEGLARTGAWLAHLHAARDLPPAEVETDRMLAGLAFPLGRLREGGAAPPMLGAAASLLERAAASLRGVAVPCTWLHGDFKPHNILLSADRTTGLDLRLNRESTILPDIANFLNHLDLMCYRPRGLRLARRAGALRAAFLAGYATAGRAVPKGHLLWLRLANLIHQWARSAPDRHLGMRGFYRRLCCERLAGSLAAELAGAVLGGSTGRQELRPAAIS